MKIELRKVARSPLWIVILVAVILRVIVALFMGDQVVALPGTHDQISYNALALRLLEGKGYSFDTGWYPFTSPDAPTAHWSFIYPAYLAGIYSLFGIHPLVARIVQALIVGIATCLLVNSLASRLFGERVGLIAAALAAGYTYFVYYSGALMTEAFFMVTSLAAIECVYHLVQSPSLGSASLFGVCSGLATLLRQTFLFFFAGLVLWLWWQRQTKLRLYQLVLPILVVIISIAPWTVRNYLIYDQFLLLNSNAGYALYSSVHPGLGTRWTAATSVTPVPAEWLNLNEAQLDRKLTSTAVEYILDDPGRYVLLTLSKVGEQFRFWPTVGSGLISNLQRLASFAWLLPLSVFGIYLSRKRWREAMPMLLFFVVISGLHLLTWPSARYRVPTDACLMPFAAVAIGHLWARLPFHKSTQNRADS